MGVVGGSTSTGCVIENCNNLGNVITHLGCRTGGFSGQPRHDPELQEHRGHHRVTVDGANYHGPGWPAATTERFIIKGCIETASSWRLRHLQGRSKTAPAAMHATAVCQQSNYNTEENTDHWTGRFRPTTTGNSNRRSAPSGREVHLLRVHQPARARCTCWNST